MGIAFASNPSYTLRAYAKGSISSTPVQRHVVKSGYLTSTAQLSANTDEQEDYGAAGSVATGMSKVYTEKGASSIKTGWDFETSADIEQLPGVHVAGDATATGSGQTDAWIKKTGAGSQLVTANMFFTVGNVVSPPAPITWDTRMEAGINDNVGWMRVQYYNNKWHLSGLKWVWQGSQWTGQLVPVTLSGSYSGSTVTLQHATQFRAWPIGTNYGMRIRVARYYANQTTTVSPGVKSSVWNSGTNPQMTQVNNLYGFCRITW